MEGLIRLDLSNNKLSYVPESITGCIQLHTLYLGGNKFAKFPEPLCNMSNLRRLYLGANQLAVIPESVSSMQQLEVLYLGGNRIRTVTPALGSLVSLGALYLGDNMLSTLPSTLGNLKNLRSLNLHNNRFSVLPTDILSLTMLEQLSLRGNPLVSDFANELPSEVPSLTELCGRFIKNTNMTYSTSNLPAHLVSFLDSAKRCTNPTCAGVYFTHHSKAVNFVDFCGKYRLPLMKYLCATCPEDRARSRSHLPSRAPSPKLNKVLLGDYREPSHETGDGV